ncbi:MAG: GIY-YIG nuclease family protein [Planctomycetes bacterium]|nr:GIY-YIG nuclease family protein [Planctomycetota bacterium]
MPAFVYLLRCRDGSLYCGWSTDPQARAAAHNGGRGAAYTRSRLPVRLVYVEPCRDKSAALRREYAIKCLDRRAKLALLAAALKKRAGALARSRRRRARAQAQRDAGDARIARDP